MAPHSNTLAWKIPWMEEPGGLQYMGLQRVGHDCAANTLLLNEGVCKVSKALTKCFVSKVERFFFPRISVRA